MTMTRKKYMKLKQSTPIMSSILLEPFCNAFMGYATHRAWSVGTGLSDLAIVRLVKANSET